jgi:hypothetical protein
MNERTVFMTALEKADSAQRKAYLDEVCAGDAAMRDRIEALLRSHEREGKFLDVPAIEQLGTPGLKAVVSGDTHDEAAPPIDDGLPDFLAASDTPGSLGRLGHYEIEEVIGRGGMGTVLRAFDAKLHRVVAIKVMAAQLATSTTARLRFAREAQAAAAVSHDHIVTIHAVEERDPLPYLVMQYVAGLSLQQRLDRDGPLELQEILRIGMQTASGLAAAHAQGLVHRDIKPANILLENGVERVKITDFGLARAASEASLTQSGVVAGTPQYMSPEQAEGKPIDQRTDLFSLGSVLYAMCSGRAPFRATGTMAVLKRVCEETPSPIRDGNPEIPDWLVAIIERLHAKDPAGRYQSAAEVAELLSQHLAHVQHPSVMPLPPAAASPARSSSSGRRWRWAAAALLLCLIGGLGLSEATGVTQLAATVIRILTPDGTLVVEANDTSVKVTIEGDSGIVITGAGLEEIRLRPGSYRVHADKNGRPIPLEKELVNVARGGRAIVKVKLEPPPATVAGKAEKGAFVRLGSAALPECKFDTLAEAVLTASDGDIIEVRGNGPFFSEPIVIHLSLTVRAGKGFLPVIKLTPGVPGDAHLILALAPLVLEGLDIREVSKARSQPILNGNCIIYCDAKSLNLANCRLLQEEPVNEAITLIMTHSAVNLRNCDFHNQHGGIVGFGNDVPLRFSMDNCLVLAQSANYLNYCHAANEMYVEWNRNTFVVPWAVTMGFSVAPDPVAPTAPTKRVRFMQSGNVFDVRLGMLLFTTLDPFREQANWQKAENAEAVFTPLIDWREQRNLYLSGASSINWTSREGSVLPFAPGNLRDWQSRWNLTKSESLEGAIRFQGGDLLARAAIEPEKLSPEDFRVRTDSAGYRAGPDGKDLGADVDLVGPGEAYERWKKTPEYQEWLKETGQMN